MGECLKQLQVQANLAGKNERPENALHAYIMMVLTTLTDVDVVLGMDVLSQFDVKIDFKNQVASPERESCTPLKLTETVGLLLENPTFTFKGKVLVKEEEAEEVIKGVHRQGHLREHKT